MKTIIELQVFAWETEIQNLARAINNCNKGECDPISLNDVIGYLRVRNAQFPVIALNYMATGHSLVISNKEKEQVATLTWKEVYELNENAVDIAEKVLAQENLTDTERDLLTQENLS